MARAFAFNCPLPTALLPTALNYFNYFTEIEDIFIRRRGKHLLLSPVDWALIESWKEMGVPLHVALSGIERAFDSFNAKPRRRTVKSLLYCQEEVEAQFAEWQESQVGAAAKKNGESVIEKTFDETHLPFPRAAIVEHLARAAPRFNRFATSGRNRARMISQTLSHVQFRACRSYRKISHAPRDPDAEKLEASLTSLEKLLDEALLANLSQRENWRRRASLRKNSCSPIAAGWNTMSTSRRSTTCFLNVCAMRTGCRV